MSEVTPEDALRQFLAKSPVAVYTAHEPPAQKLSDVTDEAKLAFLAHILRGTDFKLQFDIANVGYVTYATLPMSEVERIYVIAKRSEVDGVATPDNRAARIRSYMSLASTQRLYLDDADVDLGQYKPFDLTKYARFTEAIPYALIVILEEKYSLFSGTLQRLIDGVSDRSFWTAPLSQQR